ncbi:Ankyrin repeat-containing domain protein [Elaphomyces granulatus]
MPLSDLPREVLLDIAGHLDDADLNAFSRTNSQVYDILNWYLYRRDMAKSQIRSCFFDTEIGVRYRSRSLFWGIKNEVEGTVQLAIAAGRYLDPLPRCYDLALEHVADTGDAHLVELLLEIDGLDPNLGRDPFCDCLPLIQAAKKGHSAVVELFLAAADINPNAGDLWFHLTALHYACKGGYVHIMKQLLARDDVNVNVVSEDGSSPLHFAIISPYPEVVIKLLLHREDIDVNKQDDHGWTALSLAAFYHLFEAAKLLLGRDDIDLNVRNKYGRTALFCACDEKHLSMIKLLLEKEGVDPNCRDNNGCTPLAHACLVLKSVDIVRSLLSHPDTDPNAIDNNGVSILAKVTDNATSWDNGEIESLLRSAGGSY